MTERVFVVHARWDGDAGRWWAESDDIPGLVTEAASFEGLVENVLALAPDLLELNGVEVPEGDFPIHVLAERVERIPALS